MELNLPSSVFGFVSLLLSVASARAADDYGFICGYVYSYEIKVPGVMR